MFFQTHLSILQFISILCFFCLKHTSAQSCGVSNVPQKQTRIVGGIEAASNSFPWVAYLWNCAATIINDQWLVTAAHCVEGDKPSNLDVFLGYHDISKLRRRNISRVSKIIMHEKFLKDPKNAIEDIALIKLSTKVNFTNVVRPACLPNRYYPSGTVATVIGWGQPSSRNHTMSNTLRQVDVPIRTLDDCTRFLDVDDKKEYCAGYQQGTVIRDACGGDSGGPLMVKEANGAYTIIGIVSAGGAKEYCDGYGIYVSVFGYLDWIEKKMREN